MEKAASIRFQISGIVKASFVGYAFAAALFAAGYGDWSSPSA